MHSIRCDAGLALHDARDFLAPRQVLLGDGCSARLGPSLESWGVSSGTALVVCDPIVADLGLVDPLTHGLEKAGWKTAIFSGVATEPTIEDADAAAEAARKVQASVVVGVGGGSCMDVAKIAALLVTNEGSVADHIGADLPSVPTAPLALVPTTTGTGAEATRIAMLSVGGTKRIISNRFLVPLVAVLDSDLVSALPASVTASTGLDALAHAVESFLSTSSTMLTTTMSLRAAELIREWLPASVEDPDRREARRATLYAAYLAGLSLNAGVVLGHSMAYTIANRTNLAHGVTCAMALPFCLAYNAAAPVEGIQTMAQTLTAGRYTELQAAADWLAEINERLGIPPTPAAVGIPEHDAEEMAKECLEQYPRPTNPTEMTPEGLSGLYRAMFDGNVGGVWSS